MVFGGLQKSRLPWQSTTPLPTETGNHDQLSDFHLSENESFQQEAVLHVLASTIQRNCR
jgi:hypothetical protein